MPEITQIWVAFLCIYSFDTAPVHVHNEKVVYLNNLVLLPARSILYMLISCCAASFADLIAYGHAVAGG